MDNGAKLNKVSLIIPAYNEEKKLAETLDSLVSYFTQADTAGFEIIVVCNGCRDKTPQIAEDFSRKFTQVHALNVPERIGKGGAIRQGFRIAKGDIISYVDADGSVKPAEVWKLVQRVSHGCDGAISSRSLPGAVVINRKPLKWRLASRGYNLLVKLFFGLPFHDTQCGAKAFKRELIQSLLDDIWVNGMTFDVELLWKAKRKGYHIEEIPITWEHESKKNGITDDLFGTTIRMARDIVKLRFKS